VTAAIALGLAHSTEIDDADGEASLVEAAKTDAAALGRLYRRYEPVIAGFVMRRVGRRHEAEDIIANVFLQMVRRLGSYQRRDVPFRAWLYRIATNEIHRWFRWRKLRRFWGSVPERAVEGEAPGDDGERVRAALQALPGRYQSVIALRYLEELSIEEIAVVLGCAPGTVKSRLDRGRERLRILLGGMRSH
jgi:RNA polymerase sigma-70 factor (ECF subfamily)